MKRASVFADAEGESTLFQRRKPPEGELDITPMIDVTFLLLIFFMVGARMETSRQVDLPVANQGVGVETSAALKVVIRQSDRLPSAPPELEIEGDPANDLAGLKRVLQARVEAGKPQVLIRAERRVHYGQVQQVARTVREVPGAEFFIAVQEEK